MCGPVVSMLRELIERAPPVELPAVAAPEPDEHCELCGLAIPPQHRHVLELESRELLCACRACQVLFDRDGSGGGHYRLVPDRRTRLDDFRLDDLGWLALGLPVQMAFFVRDGASGAVKAYYPSPAGATESELELESWTDIEAENPVLREMSSDVEALLVNRTGERREAFIVGVEDCYRLVALVRTHWHGFGGGDDVWRELAAFFDDLRLRSEPAG